MSMAQKKRNKSQHRIYLDYASATPMSHEVRESIKDCIDCFANPGSLYSEGRVVSDMIRDARNTVAGVLGCKPSNVIFTSGATESNNLAIRGVLDAFFIEFPGEVPHIITSAIEHSAVLEVLKQLKPRDVQVTIIPVSESGVISTKDLRDALRPHTILVSLMYANNEIGTIQPIKEFSHAIRKYKNSHTSKYSPEFPLFHTDASQAANYLDLNTQSLGVDMMSLDGGKIYGMKGTGCLFKSSFQRFSPQIVGGGQEFGLRAGTENVLAIRSFAEALSTTQSLRIKESKRLTLLREYFIDKLLQIPGTSLNGSREQRLPNNISVCIKGIDAEFVLYCLDENGVACSSASTCMNNKEDSYSYVVKAVRPNDSCEKSSLRFSLGRATTKRDINDCIRILTSVLKLQATNYR